MSSKEELIERIEPGMKLTKGFFLRVYGFAYLDPRFAEKVIERLEEAGCDRAREYYEGVVKEWKAAHDAEMERAAAWFRQKVEEERKKEEKEWKRSIEKMTEEEAKTALRRLMY